MAYSTLPLIEVRRDGIIIIIIIIDFAGERGRNFAVPRLTKTGKISGANVPAKFGGMPTRSFSGVRRDATTLIFLPCFKEI